MKGTTEAIINRRCRKEQMRNHKLHAGQHTGTVMTRCNGSVWLLAGVAVEDMRRKQQIRPSS